MKLWIDRERSKSNNNSHTQERRVTEAYFSSPKRSSTTRRSVCRSHFSSRTSPGYEGKLAWRANGAVCVEAKLRKSRSCDAHFAHVAQQSDSTRTFILHKKYPRNTYGNIIGEEPGSTFINNLIGDQFSLSTELKGWVTTITIIITIAMIIMIIIIIIIRRRRRRRRTTLFKRRIYWCGILIYLEFSRLLNICISSMKHTG